MEMLPGEHLAAGRSVVAGLTPGSRPIAKDRNPRPFQIDSDFLKCVMTLEPTYPVWAPANLHWIRSYFSCLPLSGLFVLKI